VRVPLKTPQNGHIAHQNACMIKDHNCLLHFRTELGLNCVRVRPKDHTTQQFQRQEQPRGVNESCHELGLTAVEQELGKDGHQGGGMRTHPLCVCACVYVLGLYVCACVQALYCCLAAKLVHTRRTLSSNNINSHQETASGQACNPPDPH